MANNGFKINKSVNFNPQNGLPANPVNGDFCYDGIAQSFAHYHEGSWTYLDSVGSVTDQLWLTSSDFTPTIVRNSFIKVEDAVALSHLAGISASYSAKHITVYNAGAFTIVVEPEDANEPTANNRIMTPTGGSMNLVAGEVAVFVYDIVQTRWLLVSISSNAGAQVIATTSNPGLVTLHQASLFPLDGVVLSDGDLNTANGVVGLDANRAATIAAPLSTVAALTVTGVASAAAIVANAAAGGNAISLVPPNSGSTVVEKIRHTAGFTGNLTEWQNSSGTAQIYVDSDTDLHLNSNYLHFTNESSLDNYMYGIFSGTSWRGMWFINETSNGSTTIELSGINASTPTRTIAKILLTDSTPITNGITLDDGILKFGTGTSDITAVMKNGGDFHIYQNTTEIWKFNWAGALMGVGGDRPIQNVLDPVELQDAATKNYADTREYHNSVINGNFRYWQRATSGQITQSTAGSTRDMPAADRWAIYAARGSGGSGGATLQLSRQTNAQVVGPNSQYYARVLMDKPSGASYIFSFYQEIDRDLVVRLRNKRVLISFWWRNDGFTTDQPIRVQLISGGSSASLTDNCVDGYTGGSTLQINTDVIPPTTAAQEFLVSPGPLPAAMNTLGLKFYAADSQSTWGDGGWFDIGEVMITVVDDADPADLKYKLAGYTQEGELRLCQKYYEKSYDVDTVAANDVHTGQYHGTSNFNLDIVPDVRFQTRKWQIPTTMSAYSAYTAGAGYWDETGTPGAFAITWQNTSTTGATPHQTGVGAGDIGNWFGHWYADAESY